jgi:hypothetical protein
VGLIGCGSLLLVVPLGLLLGGWVFMLALKLGILPVGMGYLVLHWRAKAKVSWKDAYTEMYVRLATTSLPLLIADAAQRPAVAGSPASLLAAGTGLALPPLAETLPAVLLRVARGNLTAETFLTASPPLGEAMPLAARARYAALYDFFFQPHETFHDELLAARQANSPVGQNAQNTKA